MTKVWQIQGRQGSKEILEAEMPGNMSDKEISVTLQRLVCTHLTHEEVISASLRTNSPRYTQHLEPIGRLSELHYGQNPWYTAVLKDAD